MTEPAKAVFLSYASQDGEAAARICNALRVAGIEVWFDQSELRGGDVWDRQIRKQIHDCALFVPIISAHSQARLEGYFRREWKLAADRTHDMAEEKAFLVPVVIDDTLERNASVPDKFRDVQWSRLPGGETPRAFVERVTCLLSPDAAHATTEIRSLGAAVPHVSAASRQPGSSPTTSRQRQAVLLLIAAVAVIGVAYVAFDKLALWKRPGGASAQKSVVAKQPGAPAQSAVPEKSIAVLPFVDLSEKHDQEYFADGMAEEILNLLVKVPELKVIGRTSSFQFKGKTDDLRKIGTALGAAYVVEGSVRRSGDHVRITAQLIDTKDGAHRWSETYDRAFGDVLKMQDEIAASLVRALQLEVTSVSRLQGRARPKSSEAYDSYLRGLHASDRFDEQGFEEAVADFRHALELDPSFVAAAEGLADTFDSLAEWGSGSPQSGWEQAREAAEAVLKLDANSAMAHAVLGDVHIFYDWDWPAAAREFKAAVSLAPSDANILGYAAMEPLAVGRWSEAAQLLDTALSLDPLNAADYTARVWTYESNGRLAEAEVAARRVVQISPTYVSGHTNLAWVLFLEGKTQEALTEALKDPDEGNRLAASAIIYSALHRRKDADEALTRLESKHAQESALSIADVYAYRGEKDKAFMWLDTAFRQKDTFLWGIKGDQFFKRLEGDPRYKAFLRKMKLPE